MMKMKWDKYVIVCQTFFVRGFLIWFINRTKMIGTGNPAAIVYGLRYVVFFFKSKIWTELTDLLKYFILT